MNFGERIKARLSGLEASGNLRELKNIEPIGKFALWEGKKYLNLSSNDYLGLGARPELIEEFYRPLAANPIDRKFALSASSSRLLTGNHPAYKELEARLGALYGGRSALVFNSGYHANVGMLPALAGPKDLILCDKLNHASIIDGMLLSGAKFRRYPHLGYEALEKILDASRGDFENVFIVTESVFSMDGDLADLKRLAGLKKKYGAVLIVDEAHAVGVFGENGLGLCEAQGVLTEIDIIIGTFGKALCSAGAYGIMSPEVRDFLVNAMRPLIFTTGLPPVSVAWSGFVLDKAAAMKEERERLSRLSAKLREGLARAGHKTLGDSQIVPLVVGENRPALALAERLREAGLLVFAIRPPTVPKNTARLRFSLTSALDDSDIAQVLAAL
ncbi:8-amino-7-oxononanoate synthase [bacterium]|nr:MAG: 8-amino-7-oxononanoate synthase [bacterium]